MLFFEVSSTKGMQRTVKTSDLFNRRLSQVDRRIEIMVDAVRNRNFKAFAELTMKDSNQFHATCLDSYPPIHYLNGTSFEIIDFVHEFNGHEVKYALPKNCWLGVSKCFVKKFSCYVYFIFSETMIVSRIHNIGFPAPFVWTLVASQQKSRRISKIF